MNTHDIIRAWAYGEDVEDLTPEQRRAIAQIASGTADERELLAAGEAFVMDVKGIAPQTRCHACGPFEKANKEAGVIPWVFSDESVDRMGDIVRQRGLGLKNFRKNPVILFGHNDRGEPIGKAENIRKVEVKGSPATVADIKFAVEESEDAARKFRLAAGGFIKAGSIGFKPFETKVPKDDDERQSMGLGRFGVVFEKSELLEFSLVTVPANANALQQGIKAGDIDERDADWYAAITDPTEKEWEKYARKRARAFVDMGASGDDMEAMAPLHRVGDGSRETAEFLAARGVTVNDPSFTWGTETLKSIADSQAKQNDVLAELASSQRMLARSITDLGDCLGGIRKVPDTEPSDAEDPVELLTEIRNLFNRGTE